MVYLDHFFIPPEGVRTPPSTLAVYLAGVQTNRGVPKGVILLDFVTFWTHFLTILGPGNGTLTSSFPVRPVYVGIWPGLKIRI